MFDADVLLINSVGGGRDEGRWEERRRERDEGRWERDKGGGEISYAVGVLLRILSFARDYMICHLISDMIMRVCDSLQQFHCALFFTGAPLLTVMSLSFILNLLFSYLNMACFLALGYSRSPVQIAK